MKVGDLVRYKKFPHEELHYTGMTGIVFSNPHVQKSVFGDIITVEVMWSEYRRPAENNLNILREAVEELEIIK